MIAPVSPRAQRAAGRRFGDKQRAARLERRSPVRFAERLDGDARHSRFRFKSERRENRRLVLIVTIPANARNPILIKFANAVVDGKNLQPTMQEIAYPHIQTHRRYTSAEIAAKVLDLKVAPVRVGYIMGTGDTVPEAIRRLV
jgi:hypothetical protein